MTATPWEERGRVKAGKDSRTRERAKQNGEGKEIKAGAILKLIFLRLPSFSCKATAKKMANMYWFASKRAVLLFLRARAMINFLMRAARTLEITNGEQRALRKFSASWNLSLLRISLRGTGMAQFWERSPSTNQTNVAWVSRRHMWVEFVVSSLLCSERFFSGYSGFPLSSKTNIFKFQFDPDCTDISEQVLVSSLVLLG